MANCIISRLPRIKTVNNNSLLGSGNISVQPTLTSGTNIKTINNNSILGSGNISISGSAIVAGSHVAKSGTYTCTGRGICVAARSDGQTGSVGTITLNGTSIGFSLDLGNRHFIRIALVWVKNGDVLKDGNYSIAYFS